MNATPEYSSIILTPIAPSMCTFDGWPLKVFHKGFQPFHTQFALFLCPLGVLANLINVVVLCQPRLRNSTNLLLCFLAISDGMIMFLYIFYDIFYLIIPYLKEGMPLNYAKMLLIIIILLSSFQAFSAWTIVVIAIFRMLYVRTGVRAVIFCSNVRARLAITCVSMLSIILTIPLALGHRVVPVLTSFNDSVNGTLGSNTTTSYTVHYAPNEILRFFVFITTAILIKALPVIIMSVVSIILIVSIHHTERRYRGLQKDTHERRRFLAHIELDMRSRMEQQDSRVPTGPENGCGSGRSATKYSGANSYISSGRNANQTTYMLLTIIVLYVITILPQLKMQLVNSCEQTALNSTRRHTLVDVNQRSGVIQGHHSSNLVTLS
ncbi:7 transmembrane receptor, partial [Opisthorchis viverrini]